MESYLWTASVRKCHYLYFFNQNLCYRKVSGGIYSGPMDYAKLMFSVE